MLAVKLITDLTLDDPAGIAAAAETLHAAMATHYPASWPTLEAAEAEVREALEPEKVCRAAYDAAGQMLGWVGATPNYDGHAWELHPLAVRPEWQGQGVGRALVLDLEERVRDRGGLTLYLGSDDEDGQTSLAGADLYDDLWGRIQNIHNLRRHPFEFYQKMGFQIVGVIPDANGRGKPDILMAKRV